MQIPRVRGWLVVSVIAAAPSWVAGQVIINEVLYDPAGDDVGHELLELKNVGTAAVNLSDWELCTSFFYSGPDAFDGITLAPGQLLVVHLRATGTNDAGNVYLPDFPPAFPPVVDGTLSNFSDDMSLYDCSTAGCFGDLGATNRMIDFVQWGVTGVGANQERHNLAADVTRPGGALWSSAFALDHAPLAAEGQSIAFDGTNGGGAELTLGTDYVVGTPTIGLDNGACTADAQCDDSVPCTDNRCMAGACVFTPNNAMCPSDGLFCNGTESCHATQGCISSGNPCGGGTTCVEATDTCAACQTDANCNDGNPCTMDRCIASACSFTTIPGCCSTDSECNDNLGCTTDRCIANQCTHAAVVGCMPCAAAADCDDENPCTNDACQSLACTHSFNTSDCDDGEDCTEDDRCANGACVGTDVVDCCTSDAQCSDDDECTTDECANGRCRFTLAPNCANCAVDADCDDADACTVDSCVGGVCETAFSDAVCDDGDACTDGDTCSEGVCRGAVVEDCCATSDDCGDADECTSDACAANRCVFTAIANCDDPGQDLPDGNPDVGTPDAADDEGAAPSRPARSACGIFGMLPLIGLLGGLACLRHLQIRW